MLATIKRTYKKELEKLYNITKSSEDFSIASKAIGQRALRNTVLSLLTATHGTGCAKRSKDHYIQSNNMTDRIAAMTALAPMIKSAEREEIFNEFYEEYKTTHSSSINGFHYKPPQHMMILFVK